MNDEPVDPLGENRPLNGMVTALRSSQRDDLERLLAAYRPYLRSLAEQSLPAALERRVDGSDLVQETLLRGVARLDEFRGTTDAELAAWLKQILENLLVGWVRFHTADKRDLRQEVPAHENLAATERSPSSVVRQGETCEQLSAAMQKLTPEQQLVIGLRSQGQGFDEIGQQLGRSTDAARMVWARAISRLGKLMQSDGRASG